MELRDSAVVRPALFTAWLIEAASVVFEIVPISRIAPLLATCPVTTFRSNNDWALDRFVSKYSTRGATRPAQSQRCDSYSGYIGCCRSRTSEPGRCSRNRSPGPCSSLQRSQAESGSLDRRVTRTAVRIAAHGTERVREVHLHVYSMNILGRSRMQRHQPWLHLDQHKRREPACQTHSRSPPCRELPGCCIQVSVTVLNSYYRLNCRMIVIEQTVR